MASRLAPDVRVYPNPDALSAAVARGLVDILRAVTSGAGRCSLALAGGNTPRALYRLLGSAYRAAVSWERVDIFWGDERLVPPDDPRSNFRIAKETWLDQIAIPAENVHPMPTGLSDPDAVARSYEATLRAHFPGAWPRFDVILLGLGADAHTASLFPGSPALDERERWVASVRAPVEPRLRLTLTLPVLNHAARIWFLVAGADKAPALQQTLAGASEAQRRPAAAIRPTEGTLTWWVDEPAAALVAQRRFEDR